MSSQPVVLITGTSSGIGLAVAVAAARAGWRSVATMRDTARAARLVEAAEAAGVVDRVEVRQLDVTDAKQVADCLGAVVADHGRLDAVINNAGAGHLGTVELEPVEAIRSVMEVNFFGVVQVSRAAMPHLRASGGRLITVTSVGGVVGQPFNEAYCAAKFAVEGFMEALAPVAATVGVGVSVVEPGAVASDFVANVGVDPEAALAAAGPYAAALGAYLARTRSQFANAAQSPDEAAQRIVEALTADKPAFRLQTSGSARQFVGLKLADLDGAAVQTVTGGWVG
ncbi:SDR family NAD(P)-dependent oxidoreductase [Dactylosporangium vinaceum]|uniref:SDR family NAD(P)-dependent oxidoreductase n=1 Tax=Dactylosporangium vinaceum TaxID=53362 RepID=A0ABV5MF47_9ACTN|nr:SDR family NAD(P)-dependent oxidoreductase [Dactylosporangium vinaceum]UAB96993.1 SDR family NAD(P)-dependent oxidoreductase [Dactylosporangium vinaceum]